MAGKEAGNDAADTGDVGVSLLTKAASLPMDIRRMCRLIREQARSHTFFTCRKIGDVSRTGFSREGGMRHTAKVRVCMRASSRLKPVPRKLRVRMHMQAPSRLKPVLQSHRVPSVGPALAGKSPGNDAADTDHVGVSLLTKAASLPMDIRRMCRLIREQARSHVLHLPEDRRRQ